MAQIDWGIAAPILSFFGTIIVAKLMINANKREVEARAEKNEADAASSLVTSSIGVVKMKDETIQALNTRIGELEKRVMCLEKSEKVFKINQEYLIGEVMKLNGGIEPELPARKESNGNKSN